MPISGLIRYINSGPDDPSDFTARLDATQALNIIVAGSPDKDEAIFQSGQNKLLRRLRDQANQRYNVAYQKSDLGGCLIGIWGYYSRMRTSTSRCSTFYPEMNLLDLFAMWRGKEGLERFINKLRVGTEHTKRMETIKGFSYNRGNLNSITIKCDDYTSPVSVAE